MTPLSVRTKEKACEDVLYGKNVDHLNNLTDLKAILKHKFEKKGITVESMQ